MIFSQLIARGGLLRGPWPEIMTFDNRSSLDPGKSGFSLAVRLYFIFGLFAVLTAAIALLSDYNSRRSRELTDAIETANTAALNVERVNGLVYAVVMESRGVYMSDKPDVVRKFGDGILKFNEQILAVVQKWQAIVRADDAEQFATFRKRIEQFVEFRKELVRRGNEIGPAAGREWGDNDANRSVRQALNKDLDALAKVYAERGKTIAEQTTVNRELSFLLTCLAASRWSWSWSVSSSSPARSPAPSRRSRPPSDRWPRARTRSRCPM
jgi:methyl-accepting chemotaxis protein